MKKTAATTRRLAAMPATAKRFDSAMFDRRGRASPTRTGSLSRRGHPLARRREIAISELAGERFNAPPAEGFTRPFRAMLERLCHEAGFEPDVAYVLRDVTVARAFVAAGLCVTLIAELTLSRPHADVAVRPILGDVRPARTILAIWRRDRRVPSVRPMVACLAETARVRLG